MLVFEIKGSNEVGEKVGSLFERSFFSRFTCEIYPSKKDKVSGNVNYYSSDNTFICDYDEFSVSDIDLITVPDFPNHCCYRKDIRELSFEALADMVASVSMSKGLNHDTSKVDDWVRERELDKRRRDAIEKEIEEDWEKLHRHPHGFPDEHKASERKESEKPSVLDIVLEEAANSQNKNDSNNLNSSYQTCTGYNDARIVLVSMISDYLHKGSQVISSGIYFAHEIGQYVIYVVAV